MADNNKFTELDFDEIRESIVDYLKTKTEFQDFQFEGPAISLLIDALAYTATYTAVHANMAVSETFIDSAQLRNSIISKAKELNYIPRSVQSPYIDLDLVFTHPKREQGEGLAENLVLPRGVEFSVEIGTNQFNFVTAEAFNFKEEFDQTGLGGIYRAPIRIYQGTIKEAKFTIPLTTESKIRERFQIPSQNIDTRFLAVRTEDSGQITNWYQAKNVTTISSSSPVYFLQEGIDGIYEIYFGDDIIGSIPPSDSTLIIEYLNTIGAEANGLRGQVAISNLVGLRDANELFANDSDLSTEDFIYDKVTEAREGAERESNESIRLAAPRSFQSQNRAVTKDDYIAILQNKYGFIKTMSVWGGEDNDPPRYGSTFIAIKPKRGTSLTPVTKETIRDDLVNNFSVVAITPILVDPDSVFVFLDINANYRIEEANISAGQITRNIQTNVKEFFDSNVTFFNKTMRYSRLLRTIDDSNPSIRGSTTSIKIAKKFQPNNQRAVEVQLSFYNSLVPGTVNSREFKNTSGNILQLKDNGKGKMNLTVNGRTSLKNIASVDYDNGKIQINGLRNTELRRFVFRVPEGTEIIIEADPVKRDLIAKRSGILELDPKELNINTVQLEFQDD